MRGKIAIKEDYTEDMGTENSYLERCEAFTLTFPFAVRPFSSSSSCPCVIWYVRCRSQFLRSRVIYKS